jgi:predicted nucleic acid-binding protein
VTERRWRGPAVVDTDVYSAELVRGSELAERYEPLILGRPVFISFQTAAEIRFGGLLRGWGPARMRQLGARLEAAEIVHSGPELITVHAQLRVECRRVGHPLADKIHDGDRWIAATALRLGVPLVTNDAIFENVPGLDLESLRAR